MIDAAIELLDDEKEKDRRRALYFIIGKLGAKLREPRCAAELMSRLPRETDKYILSSALDVLADVPKPQGTSLSPVFALLADERWLVRRSAINALRNTTDSEAEDRLPDLLERTDDPYDQADIHATLNRIGTTRSLPLLARGAKSRHQH